MDKVFDFKEYVLLLGRQRKIIIFIALIFGIIFGSYQFSRSIPATPEGTEGISAESIELAILEQDVKHTKRLMDDFNKQYQQFRTEYSEDQLIDHYLFIQVEGGDKAGNTSKAQAKDKTDILIDTYLFYLTWDWAVVLPEVYESKILGDMTPFELKYLYHSDVIEEESNIINIYFRYNNKEEAREIASRILSLVTSKVTEKIGNHEVKIIEERTVNAQTAVKDKINESLKEDKLKMEEDYKNAKNKYDEAVKKHFVLNTSQKQSSPMRSVLVYIVVGLAVGLIISMILFYWRYSIDKRISSITELANCQLPLIGDLSSLRDVKGGPGKHPIDQSKGLRLAVAEIRNSIKLLQSDGGIVLITGQYVNEGVTKVFTELVPQIVGDKQYKIVKYDENQDYGEDYFRAELFKHGVWVFVLAPLIFEAPITAEIAHIADAIIIVEKRYKSLHPIVEKQKVKYESFGKRILGIVLV